jgi:hypothetical protein
MSSANRVTQGALLRAIGRGTRPVTARWTARAKHSPPIGREADFEYEDPGVN